MMRYFIWLSLLFIIACASKEQDQSTTGSNETKVSEYAMVIHGGAGVIRKENMTPEKEAAYRSKLNEALSLGDRMLSNGDSAIDVVVQVISLLEDSPLFNAGKGAVFTHNGTNEMDASIMQGWDQNAGAISGVTHIKNPITAARAVLEKSDHVLLSGAGAEEFAFANGCDRVEADYFYTEDRWESLQRVLSDGVGMIDSDDTKNHKFGTVGCVVLDKYGNIVAGTSTGGMTNKRYNRIGDSPIIGAGTYADNATCGVSSTGHGEFFIRYTVAHDIAARMEYKSISLEQAAHEVVMEKLVEKGGSGGIIALDKYGNIAMPFNTEGMFRGYIKPGVKQVKIYKDE